MLGVAGRDRGGERARGRGRELGHVLEEVRELRAPQFVDEEQEVAFGSPRRSRALRLRRRPAAEAAHRLGPAVDVFLLLGHIAARIARVSGSRSSGIPWRVGVDQGQLLTDRDVEDFDVVRLFGLAAGLPFSPQPTSSAASRSARARQAPHFPLSALIAGSYCHAMKATALERLGDEIHACRRCPRLVEWREAQAADPPRRYRGEEYWARPLSGFGDPDASWRWSGSRPLPTAPTGPGGCSPATAPATGSTPPCTGRGSPTARAPSRADDGLRLEGAYVTAVVRCAPPANRPTPVERDNCLPFLERELALLAVPDDPRPRRLRLGRGAARAAGPGGRDASAAARFGHEAEARVGEWTLLGSLPPEPAEHLHRPADRADARFRDRQGPGDRSTRLGTICGSRPSPTPAGRLRSACS